MERRNSLHVAMVAKFLGLNKPWSCKVAERKTEKIDITFLCMIALRNNFCPNVRWCKWPSLSREFVAIQRFCYHGKVTSYFSSLYIGERWVAIAAIMSKHKRIGPLLPLKFQFLKWVRSTLCLEWGYKINPVPMKMYRAEIKEGKGPC